MSVSLLSTSMFCDSSPATDTMGASTYLSLTKGLHDISVVCFYISLFSQSLCRDCNLERGCGRSDINFLGSSWSKRCLGLILMRKKDPRASWAFHVSSTTLEEHISSQKNCACRQKNARTKACYVQQGQDEMCHVARLKNKEQ
jgi:hypothetical protein